MGLAVLPGSLLLTVGAIVLQIVVKVYLAPKLGRSVNTYGLLGAASVILLWLFIVARLITVSRVPQRRYLARPSLTSDRRKASRMRKGVARWLPS